MEVKTQASLEELYHLPENGKAEMVHGEIVPMSPTGSAPGRAGGAIYFSLRLYERRHSGDRAYPDNVGFLVHLPHRQSISPDAAFFTGRDTGMRFPEGAPIFAAEVRSENDYGPQAEQEMAAKRADYFAAGTQVVWDVDLLSEDVVQGYQANDPPHPTIFRRGEVANAEPAVPGWSMPVDELFE